MILFCYEVLQKRIVAVVIWSNVMHPYKDFIISLKRQTVNGWSRIPNLIWYPVENEIEGKPSQAQLLIESYIPFNALKRFCRFMYWCHVELSLFIVIYACIHVQGQQLEIWCNTVIVNCPCFKLTNKWKWLMLKR